MYRAFVWARRALHRHKRRLPARAGARDAIAATGEQGAGARYCANAPVAEGELTFAKGDVIVVTEKAGLDEGILSFSLPVLFYI